MSGNENEENKISSYFIVNRKWILWAILIVGGFFFLNKRYISVNGSFTSVDIIILLFWIALLLMPFFQEINFYGLKLKKEIDELRLDVDKQFIDLSRQFISLRAEINNSNNFHPQITNNFTTPIPDNKLPPVEETKQDLEQRLNSSGAKKSDNDIELMEIPEDVLYLFSVKYQIEAELRRINKESHLERNAGQEATPETIRNISSIGLIDRKLSHTLRLVHNITATAIHGAEVSEAKIHFVREIAPDLIATLKEISGYNETS